MGQHWLNQEPGHSRSLLQMSLFGTGGVYAPEQNEGQADSHLLLVHKRRAQTQSTQTLAKEHLPVQRDLVDEAADHGDHGVQSETILHRKAKPLQESQGPDLDLDDETLLYFRKVGVRDLFAEMVLQTIRDCIYSRDEDRMNKLRAKNPEEHEERIFSAEWLTTKAGHLAVQMLYPDWDHLTIIRRIYEDPKGILSRMSAAGVRRHQESVAGFDESPLSDDSGFSGRLETWGDADISGDEFSYRQG